MPVAKKKRRTKKAPKSTGLTAVEITSEEAPANVRRLGEQIEEDGGKAMAFYRDPLGGHWQILASLPLDKVKPTSFQRDLSDAHVKRLGEKIERLNRYLDPITVVRSEAGEYLTPNGHHRTSAMNRLGARAIIAMVIPDFEIAYQILALNTEKAYNLKEKSLEAIRLARQLAEWHAGAREEDYAEQFEEAGLVTLGLCYEKKKNFPGGAYNPILRRTASFSSDKIAKALSHHGDRSERLMELESLVTKMVDKLKAKGLKSPYLKTFVVARINPLRFSKDPSPDFDKTLDKMMGSLSKMNPEKIEQHHLASMAFAAPDEG